MYLLRRGLDRTTFVGTTVVFFAVVNFVKLLPYAWLGQLNHSNLMTSLVLAPLGPLAIRTGLWLHRRMTEQFFFRAAWVTLLVVGLKLVADSLAAMN